MKYLILVIVGLLSYTNTQAQDLQSIFDNQIKQHKWLDPSYVKIDTGITVVLPGFDYRFLNSGPSLKDIIIDKGEGIYELQLENQLDNFAEEEYINGEFSIPVIGLDWRIGSQMLSLGYQLNMQSMLTYKKDLIELYQLGNAPFIDETLDLGPDFLVNAYQEIYFGYARDFGAVNVGARVKFLTGMADLSTSANEIGLYTDPDIYQLTTTTDYVVNGSGSLEYNSLDDLGLSFEPFEFGAFGRNMGWGLDVAISGVIGEKFTYGLSAIDIGKINWNLNTTNITSVGEASFEGINVVGLLNDKNDIVLEDSIKQLLDFVQTRDNYNNQLFSKFYGHINFDVTSSYSIGALINAHQANEELAIGYAINNNIKLGSAFGLNAMLGMYVSNPFLGLGIRWTAGPFQLALSVDNTLAFFNGGNYNSGRFGWSVSF